MSSYLDSIPQAVATIVSSCIAQGGTHKGPDGKDVLEKWVLDLTDKLTRAFTQALREEEAKG